MGRLPTLPFSKRILLSLATDLFYRLRYPLLAVALVFLLGTGGYMILGHGQVGLLDSIYMTSITLTTVGYGEIFPLDDTGRWFTTFLMWAGMGAMVYATAVVTSFFVEINLGQWVREQIMKEKIAQLRDHYIVCGMSETAQHIIRELYETAHPFVVVEVDPQKVEQLKSQYEDVLVIQGDATEENVLTEAGIQRARGLFGALGSDSRNMLLTVVARYVNPHIKIVTACRDNNLINKFYRAGADYVVNPAYIGGMRMASEMLRPQVVTFLDRMLRGQTAARVEQAVVEEGSPIAGKTLAEARILERTGLLPIALEMPDGRSIFNPTGDERLEPGTAIIVIGTPEQVARLRAYCGGK